MNICKLISDELEVISSHELPTLTPKNYDEVTSQLNKKIELAKLLQKILDLNKKAIELVDASFKKIYEVGKSLEYYISRDHKDISEHTLVYIGNLTFEEYQKHNVGVTKFPDSLKVVFGSVRVIESNITVVDLAHVEFMTYIQKNNNLTKVKVLSCNQAVYIDKNPNLQVATIGDVRGISIIKNNNLKSVSVHSSISFDASECIALEEVSVMCVDQGISISNCKKLKRLRLEYVRQDIRLVSLPELKLKNIHDFNNKKICVGTFFFPNKGLCKPEPSDLLGNLSYSLNAREYIKNQILKKFDMTKDGIVISNL